MDGVVAKESNLALRSSRVGLKEDKRPHAELGSGERGPIPSWE